MAFLSGRGAASFPPSPSPLLSCIPVAPPIQKLLSPLQGGWWACADGFQPAVCFKEGLLEEVSLS